jgi:hypothetical protein
LRLHGCDRLTRRGEGFVERRAGLLKGALPLRLGASEVSKRSILDVIGRTEAFQLMERAVVQAAKKNKESGLTTACNVNGRTVITRGQATTKKAEPKKPVSVRSKAYTRAA